MASETSENTKGPPPAAPPSVAGLESIAPPQEFQLKEEETKLFAGEGVRTWKKYPCSLHFDDAVPSPQAVEALGAFSDVLGPLGTHEGHYGAGGGPIHILYLGTPEKNDESSFAPLPAMLDALRLSPPLAELKFFTTLDPLHQVLFPKTMKETLEAASYDPSPPKKTKSTDEGQGSSEKADQAKPKPGLLEQFYNLVSSEALPTRLYNKFLMEPRTTKDFPFLKEARIVFLQPEFDNLHGGTCIGTECSQDRSFICEESTGGIVKAAGDVYESPCFAMFQLQSTGELMALANWDYRD